MSLKDGSDFLFNLCPFQDSVHLVKGRAEAFKAFLLHGLLFPQCALLSLPSCLLRVEFFQHFSPCR
jgi:hypothetical protein